MSRWASGSRPAWTVRWVGSARSQSAGTPPWPESITQYPRHEALVRPLWIPWAWKWARPVVRWCGSIPTVQALVVPVYPGSLPVLLVLAVLIIRQAVGSIPTRPTRFTSNDVLFKITNFDLCPWGCL
jgi:hypothetical protein